jgi:putative peptidoglycan binding protein
MMLNNRPGEDVQIEEGKLGKLMKRTLFAIFIGTVALAVAAPAAEQHQKRAAAGGNRAKAAVTSSAHARGGSHIQRSRQVGVRQHTSTRAFSHRAAVSNQTRAKTTIARSNLRAKSGAATSRVTSRENGFRRNQATARNHTATRNFAARERVNRVQNRNVTVNRARNGNRHVALVNHWRGDRFAGRHYAAFRNYHRAWHDRGWWRNHYNRIIFVSGGWYFWNSGYWYPAWGYDPGYEYPYDGPIYGAATLSPDQIVMNAQQQLQDEGYYNGPIDGILGSQTRYALAAFQADHGLAVTSAVDEPTLASLGIS